MTIITDNLGLALFLTIVVGSVLMLALASDNSDHRSLNRDSSNNTK